MIYIIADGVPFILDFATFCLCARVTVGGDLHTCCSIACGLPGGVFYFFIFFFLFFIFVYEPHKYLRITGNAACRRFGTMDE